MIPKILLVDNQTENLIILIDILEDLGYELSIAFNSQEAIKLVENNDFDLILLDIMMPDIDGYEVCKRIRQNTKFKDIAIIFLTSLNSIENRIKGFKSGGDDYITKPITKEELIARVHLHIQKERTLKSLKALLRKSYHELYNPLTVINTSLELHNMKYENTKYLDSISIATRGLQLVYDDIYYSISDNKNNETIKDLEIVTFVKERIDYFYYLAIHNKITVNFKSYNNPIIQIKESDLQRIIDNTISNAIKYAKHNSIVTIEVIDTNKYVLFQSHNLGTTIKNPKKIFENGYKENFEQIGMGIGLEIVSHVCNKYKIIPKVISENEDTKFIYKIPKQIYQKIKTS